MADPEMARTLYEKAAPQNKRLVVVEGGGHNGLYREDVYQEAYRAFLSEVMTGEVMTGKDATGE
ncbi:MAG: hypothetical protein ACR2GR_03905 [Rhodothermales bacterium]